MEKNKSVLIIIAIFLIAVVLLLTAFFVLKFKEQQPPISPDWLSDPNNNSIPPEKAKVAGVIDGITIKLETGHIVRYLGVRVPEVKTEVQCFGKEVLGANEAIIGKEVRLETDPVLLRSKDGAWVRYVYLQPDESEEEIFINERILEGGFGFPLLSEEVFYIDRMMSAARYAKSTGKGLWGKCEIDQPRDGFFITKPVSEGSECLIKATEKNKYFYTKECKLYSTIIPLQSKGDKWFCSQEEAKKQGFKLAPECLKFFFF